MKKHRRIKDGKRRSARYRKQRRRNIRQNRDAAKFRSIAAKAVTEAVAAQAQDIAKKRKEHTNE